MKWLLCSLALWLCSFVFDMQAKSLTVRETWEICRPVISMPLWQMSAFGRAAGGTAFQPSWNPDETILELLVMKSGHRINLLPEMTFNLHTCRSNMSSSPNDIPSKTTAFPKLARRPMAGDMRDMLPPKTVKHQQLDVSTMRWGLVTTVSGRGKHCGLG